MKEFENKVAVITGAAEGIGKAIAQEAARRGMRLVLADLNEAALAATVEEFERAGTAVVPVTVDVSDEAGVQNLADVAFSRWGTVSLLVNNAGVALAKTAWTTTAKDWEWVIGVNLYGVTNGLRAFLPRMLEGGEAGHVVNVASIAGLLSEPGLAAYNASKFAVVAVSESLQHDLTLRKAPIKVSVLCPGWVKTRIAEAERHRDPSERSDLRQEDAATRHVGLAMQKAVAEGMEVGEVARATFQAVVEDRFYILTHPKTRDAVRTRMEDVLNDRAPSLLPI
ncbi:MAG: SDR family NAD(P)-dependent oxidoreductase [Telmatospirillum sp.]|nr:SDR family NAD(P)-dependent oxidoreductase [Telmatospirillum sp.]